MVTDTSAPSPWVAHLLAVVLGGGLMLFVCGWWLARSLSQAGRRAPAPTQVPAALPAAPWRVDLFPWK